MLHRLHAPLETLVNPALAQRLTLLFNHVLNSEPVATERLRPYSGRQLRLELENWPSLLPAPPKLAWHITRAGLLDWVGAVDAPVGVTPTDAGAECLTVRVDASNPAALFARGLLGQMPAVQVEGDAQLAGDVNWLMQNLRWDVAADVDRLFGPALAQPLRQVGLAIAAGVRSAVAGAQGLGERLRTWRA
jgi:ubiquinone biosynthesis protein UbiJ